MTQWIARLLSALKVKQGSKGNGTVQIAALHGDLTIVKLQLPNGDTAWSQLAELIARKRSKPRERLSRTRRGTGPAPDQAHARR